MRVGRETRVVVTGASKGIGRATAHAFAARGCRVGLVARGAEPLEKLASEIGGEAIALPADVGDAAEIEAAVARFAEEAGGIEVVVVNAGIAHYEPFADLPLERAEEMTRINWLGTLYTVKAALPHLSGAGVHAAGPSQTAESSASRPVPPDGHLGHIVIVSSGAALRAFPSAAVYGATKAAQRGFAEALRHELSGSGVSVTTVFPGEIATELHAHEKERMPDWYKRDAAMPPEPLAEAIVSAVERDKRVVYVPRIVRLLGLNALVPRFADRLLRMIRGGSAAPRTD